MVLTRALEAGRKGASKLSHFLEETESPRSLGAFPGHPGEQESGVWNPSLLSMKCLNHEDCGSHLGAVSSPKGPLAMSGDSFDFHDLGQRGGRVVCSDST